MNSFSREVRRSSKPYLRLVAAVCAACGTGTIAQAQNVLGIDVSDWQGTINWTSVANAGKKFAFIRSSRGGTTGTYNENTKVGTLSQRYDDFKFTTNITNAKSAGLLCGPYHFARPDITAADPNSNGIANTGADEANHMMQQAGNYMRPGYLRPVLDLEAGNTQRTTAELSAFAVEFANTIYAAKGVYPIIYINSSYANDEVNSTVTIMDQWIARWPNQTTPSAIDTNSDPPAASGYPNVYGVWNPSFPIIPNPTPWKFWQYASTGTVAGISGSVDLDVAHGDMEFLKDFLIPAMWNVDTNGDWSTASNWNSGTYLPSANDRVILNRTAGEYLITLSTGTHNVRSLQANERFTMSGGTINISQYANFANAGTIAGGNFASGSFNNSSSLTQTGGNLATGIVAGTGSINVSAGTFTATKLTQGTLNISDTGLVKISGSGATTSSVGNLSVAGTGKLDLDDNALVINYTGASPISSVKTALQTGFANGAWNGAGINSTFAATNLQKRYAIGLAESSDLGSPSSFLGQTSDSTSLLLRMTVYGDANLDGTTNSTDFNLMVQNYGLTSQRWSKGDFNYDGKIDTVDFNLLASAFGSSVPVTAPTLGNVVPEPTCGAIGVLVVSSFLRRPRRV